MQISKKNRTKIRLALEKVSYMISRLKRIQEVSISMEKALKSEEVDTDKSEEVDTEDFSDCIDEISLFLGDFLTQTESQISVCKSVKEILESIEEGEEEIILNEWEQLKTSFFAESNTYTVENLLDDISSSPK